jgi:adenylylsulfate kinase-like enzyme
MIIVLFGQPHSGKSTLAKEFSTYRDIDGDRLRELFNNKDYSREGRIRNLNRASDIAYFLYRSGTKVILTLVYPYKEARDYLNSLTDKVIWVYLTYEGERGRENFHVADFETPENERILHLDTSKLTIDECVKEIISYAKLSSKSTK